MVCSSSAITADHYEDGRADMRMAVASPVRRPPSPGEPVSVYLRLSPVFARDPLESIPATWNGRFEPGQHCTRLR
jgi:hypothetical protein